MALNTIHKVSLAAIGVLLVGIVSLAGGTKTASAEVVQNARADITFVVDNPCEPGINNMALLGTVHVLWYTTPEGSTMMRYNAHYTVTTADGTEYISNNHRVMEHWMWPTYAPFSDLIVINLVSKGDGVNARIELTVEYSATGPLPLSAYVRTVECHG